MDVEFLGGGGVGAVACVVTYCGRRYQSWLQKIFSDRPSSSSLAGLRDLLL